jgi:hypothetical protein
MRPPSRASPIFILLFYLIPILLWSGYSIALMPPQKSWWILSLGLLLSFAGSIVLILLFHKRAELTPPKEEPPPPILHHTLDLELESKLEKLMAEKEELQRHSTLVQGEFDFFRTHSLGDMEERDQRIIQLQEKLKGHESALQSKESLISDLETKVSDLKYEIKVLAHSSEGRAEQSERALEIDHEEHGAEKGVALAVGKTVQSVAEAAILLKRCLDIAQKITGAYYMNTTTPRILDLPIDHYALDLRRLFDAFRSESSGGIILYSQKERKLVFANPQTKSLSSLGPDRFVMEFNAILEEGFPDWEQALHELITHKEVQTALNLKTKSGTAFHTQALLGTIPSGLFRGYIVGVLYPE